MNVYGDKHERLWGMRVYGDKSGKYERLLGMRLSTAFSERK